MRPLVQRQRQRPVGVWRAMHAGPQRDGDKPPRAARVLLHHALGAVLIGGDNDPRLGGKVQIPQHVAGGERGDEQLLGIMPRPVAAEIGV